MQSFAGFGELFPRDSQRQKHGRCQEKETFRKSETDALHRRHTTGVSISETETSQSGRGEGNMRALHVFHMARINHLPNLNFLNFAFALILLFLFSAARPYGTRCKRQSAFFFSGDVSLSACM